MTTTGYDDAIAAEDIRASLEPISDKHARRGEFLTPQQLSAREYRSDEDFERKWTRQVQERDRSIPKQRRRALQEVRLDAWSGKQVNSRKVYKARLIERHPAQPGTCFRYTDNNANCPARVAIASGFELKPWLDYD